MEFGKAARGGLLAALVAVAGNLVVYLLARYAGGASFVIPLGPSAPPSELPLFMVLLETAVPVFLAGCGLWVLGKVRREPAGLFRIVAGVLVLLSFAGPFALPTSVDPATRFGLAFMHVVAGIAVLYIPTWSQPKNAATHIPGGRA